MLHDVIFLVQHFYYYRAAEFHECKMLQHDVTFTPLHIYFGLVLNFYLLRKHLELNILQRISFLTIFFNKNRPSSSWIIESKLLKDPLYEAVTSFRVNKQHQYCIHTFILMFDAALYVLHVMSHIL